MSEMQSANAQEQGPTEQLAPGKRVYSSPNLIFYGSVSALTQSGGTGSDEGSASGSMNMSKSDARFKHNVSRVGTHPLGFGLYLFDYRPEFSDPDIHGRQFGVMAHEVEAVMPAAVMTDATGYKRVNYAMLGIDRSQHRIH